MICRMCLLEVKDAINIFVNESPSQLNIAETINRHFWIEVTNDDQISKYICNSCWWHIERFHVYYLTVEKAQRILSKEDETLRVLIKVDNGLVAEPMHYNDPVKSVIEVFKIEEPESIGSDYNEFVDTDGEVISENEVKYKQEAADQEIEPASIVALRATNLKLDNDSTESNKTETIYSTKKEMQKKRGRKKKSETDYLKKTKKSDDEIAQQTALKCDLCISEFTIFSQLQKHCRAVHHRKGYVVCCTKKFFKRCMFLDHISRHVNPELFKCDECDKVYSHRQTLQSHMTRHSTDTIHSQIQTFQCAICLGNFASQNSLNYHKRNIHTPKGAHKFCCEECGKNFNTNDLLQNHRRNVHKNRVCHICAKVIRGKTLFTKHQLEHTGITEPKQQCKECGIWVKNTFRLKLHMKYHTETEKEHICNICGKSSPSSRALQSHIKYVHSAKRQHQCSYCDKAFKKAFSLKEHMATHTGDILYTCPHCPKTFNSGANMHSHRKKMHREEWEEARKSRGIPPEEVVHITTHTCDVLYTCPHCPKTFNCKLIMHKHWKSDHSKEWEETRKNRGTTQEKIISSEEKDTQANAVSCEDSIRNKINSA